MSPRTRLVNLLGADFPSLSAENIDQLVEGCIREDTDLDFKETLYGNGDSERRDLAGDVAALANSLGGAVILGVRDDDGRVVSAPGVVLSDAEELRMRQILAGNLAPRCAVQIYRVERSPGLGFYVLEVARSPEAPHAVRVGDSLRYPRRDGAGIRWLSESEVANAYRNRFMVARAQIDRLTTVHDEGLNALGRHGGSDYGWMHMALVPDLLGQLQIRRGTAEAVGDWLREKDHPFAYTRSAVCQYIPSTRTVFRRLVIVHGPTEGEKPAGAYWQLHSDGAGFGALPFAWLGRSNDGTLLSPKRFMVEDEALIQAVAELLGALAGFAVIHAGVSGLAALRVSTMFEDSEAVVCPVQFVHFRGEFPTLHHRSEPIAHDPLPVAEHTVDLDAIASAPSELLIASRAIALDYHQALGRPDCWQIDNDGRIRLPYIRRDNRPMVEAWARQVGAMTTEETVT